MLPLRPHVLLHLCAGHELQVHQGGEDSHPVRAAGGWHGALGKSISVRVSPLLVCPPQRLMAVDNFCFPG